MLEVFFDCSSPWTYLGFHAIRRVAQELDTPIDWRPFLVGGIFNTSNPSVYAWRAAPVPEKLRYQNKDLQDWARLYGLTINWPQRVFPVNSVKVMRGCIYLQPLGLMESFADAAFKAYWSHNRDISQNEIIADLLLNLQIDEKKFFAAIISDAIKNRLRANTEELQRRGGYGSPTFFVDGDDMYFGNDRVYLVRKALQRDRFQGDNRRAVSAVAER